MNMNAPSNEGTSSACIRPATAGDARAVNAYVAEIFESSDFLISSPNEAHMSWWRRRWWLAMKDARALETCLIAIDAGAVIGMGECYSDARARTRHVATLSMGVAASHQGKGIGKALIKALIGWANSNGVTEKLQLHVHSPNKAAIALYKGAGFIEEGVSPRAIKHADGRYIDDITMGLWLANEGNEDDTKGQN